jgi:HEAT repeat protein
MARTDKDLEQALENWRQGRAAIDEVRSLAADLGNQHYSPGIPVLLELLDHEDGIVRCNAATSLAFELHHKPATDRLLAMLERDADPDNRDVAAAGLGGLSQDSKNRGVLEALAKAALDDPDEDVRSSAYKSMLIVNGVPREEHLRLILAGNLPVDSSNVHAILAETAP